MDKDLKEADTIRAIEQAKASGYSTARKHRRIKTIQRVCVGILTIVIAAPILLPLFEQDSAFAEEALEQIDIIAQEESQQYRIESEAEQPVQDRDTYKSSFSPVTPAASDLGPLPKATSADAKRAQDYAHQLVLARGWSEADFSCLVRLWQRESGWKYTAHNRSSGAYGIPQALPGSKMKSAGADWQTNPETQVRWGLGYIKGRYGTPCGAWNFFQNRGWY